MRRDHNAFVEVRRLGLLFRNNRRAHRRGPRPPTPPCEIGWVGHDQTGSLTAMKSLVGAFLAILAINSSTLPAGFATYLTVGAALIAVVFYVIGRRGGKKRVDAYRAALATAPPASPAAGPTLVQYVYTTGPVFTAIPPGMPASYGAPVEPGPVHVASERADQVYMPGSFYR